MIRSGRMQDVQKFIEHLSREIKALIYSAMELSYFSRGAWSYQSVLEMTAGERDIAADFINKRLEIASKMPHPVF